MRHDFSGLGNFLENLLWFGGGCCGLAFLFIVIGWIYWKFFRSNARSIRNGAFPATEELPKQPPDTFGTEDKADT